MSERMVVRLVVRLAPFTCALLATAALSAVCAQAQGRAAEVQAAAQRAATRFNAAAVNLNRTTARADSITRAHLVPETPEIVRAGSIVGKVGGNAPRPNEAAVVHGVIAAAWTEMQSALGNSAAGVGAGTEILWRRDSLGAAYARRHQVTISTDGRAAMQWLQRDSDSVEAVNAVLSRYGDVALNLLTPRTRQWVGGWTPTRRPTAAQWERVAVLLATSSSSRARDCYTGVLAECLAVLSISPPANEDWWTAWYRPSDWPDAVAEWEPRDPVDSALARACGRKREMPSCALAITKFAPRAPVPGLGTHTLLAIALERGGPDAFARLVAAGGTPAEILQATAGVDAVTLVAEWRARVYAARPPRPTPTVAQSAATAFWVIAFGFLATRRRP